MIRQNAGLHGAVLFLMPSERARASGSHVSGACKALESDMSAKQQSYVDKAIAAALGKMPSAPRKDAD
eukprot:1831145-Prymnesium_polylepis.1